jgi:hypothetical protein
MLAITVITVMKIKGLQLVTPITKAVVKEPIRVPKMPIVESEF